MMPSVELLYQHQKEMQTQFAYLSWNQWNAPYLLEQDRFEKSNFHPRDNFFSVNENIAIKSLLSVPEFILNQAHRLKKEY